MTVNEIIDELNALKSNQYSDADKIKWLSELDMMIKHEFFDEYDIPCDFKGYDETSGNTELLAPEPFKPMYVHWLEAKIDYWNNEYARYNVSMEMYNAVYSNYETWFIAHHKKANNRFRW